MKTQIKSAIFNGRKLTAVKSDYNEWKQEDVLLEWPSTGSIEKVEDAKDL